MFKKILSILLFVPIVALAWEPAANKPVTVLIGFQGGSGNEVGFRVLAAEVQRANPNFNFVVELKPGADSVIASNLLYESKPDGYTIAIPSSMGTYITNDIWQKDIKKFQYNSFTEVMGMGKSPLTIVANPKSKVNTVSELIRLVQTTNRPVTFAVGSGAHRMTYEYFMWKAHGDKNLVKFVQFPGPLQTVTAVASDAGIEFGIMPISIALPLVQAGKVKVIGITGDQRLAGLPTAEPIRVGNEYIDIFAAWNLSLPPNTPAEIVKWYRDAFTAAIKTPAVKQYYKDNLIIAVPEEMNTKGFNQHIEHLRSIWMPLSQQIDLLGNK
jgi:tripartite-type tricarboxylate transporter receptor subunit TctC